jgi:tetratricopeptide (TPR) repeat protein
MFARTGIFKRSAVLYIWLVCCVAGPTAIGAQQPDPDAFVYILNLGIRDNKIVYNGLRVGFAVGDGRMILTAAHCVEDFGNGNHSLFRPLVISPYYGDIFEAQITDIDKQDDIALLKPTWDSHPGLRIDSSDRWKDARRIIIAGYEPAIGAKGKNTRISRRVSLKEEKVIRANGKGRYAFQLGTIKYPGKGWSGSAFVLPQTGEVVGILSNERYVRKFFLKRHYIFGCNPEAIRKMFRRNDLALSVFSGPISRRDGKDQFNSILRLFDSVLVDDKEESYEIVTELCRTHPDSYVMHIVAAWLLEDPLDEAYYRRAVELAANRALPYAAYGSYLLNHDRPERALLQFQNAVAVDPNHIFAQTGRIVALTRTDPAEAEEQARELTRKWPSNAAFWFDLSRALRMQRKYAGELPIIRKAVELPHPEHLRHLYRRHLADSLANNKQYSEAERAYRALLQNHRCARCWSAYTSLLIRMGPERVEDARRALAKVKAMNNDNDIPKATIRDFETAIREMTESSISSR